MLIGQLTKPVAEEAQNIKIQYHTRSHNSAITAQGKTKRSSTTEMQLVLRIMTPK